jgi:hypothetical protein
MRAATPLLVADAGTYHFPHYDCMNVMSGSQYALNQLSYVLRPEPIARSL